jgi:hypothetical protein
MKLGLRHASELLSAVIADHRLGHFSFLERWGFNASICFGVLGGRRVGGGNLLPGLVLVIF